MSTLKIINLIILHFGIYEFVPTRTPDAHRAAAMRGELLFLSRTSSSSLSVLLICVTHLVQLSQQDLGEVKGGEADPNGDGPFDPVHAQTFVESTYNALLSHYLLNGAQDGAVCVTRDPRGLHAAPYHIQRVR